MTRVRSFHDHMKKIIKGIMDTPMYITTQQYNVQKNEVKVLRLGMILAMTSPKVHKG